MATIDLSQYKKSDETPSFDSLSAEQQEAVNKMAEGEELPKQTVSYAFLVIKGADGWTLTNDLSTADLIDPVNMPDPDTYVEALNVLLSDIQAEKNANYTAVMMQRMAMAQMQQMQNAQLAQQLHLK